MWTEQQVTFRGTHYRVRDAYCEPKPDPRPPIIVGAFKPSMLRLTAKHADWWNVSSTGIDGYRRMAEQCERACAEVGRDPATLRRTWCGGCVCAPTQAHAERLAGERYRVDADNFDFVGTPAHVVAQMRAFIDAGVDYFMVDCGGFPNLTTLELLVNEVIPAVNA
jgi:alkanesulfonate monooxygenase SsuD/methylene tetrahydromethanopterin reductase-like flavin-dependent oxidoreductase (luciferase family)